MKNCLNRFLDENGGKSNQLVILFAYLFMIQENASVDQFNELKRELTIYFNKKDEESSEFEKEEERVLLMEKVSINQKLVNRYFDGTC